MHDQILFIDFDGTITAEETLNGAMSMWVDPDMYKEGVKRMQTGEWTQKEAVRFAFDNIKSSHMPDIMEYVRTVPIRKGFPELLDKMNQLNIPVVVISGGLKPYVEEKLQPFIKRLTDVYSLDIDTSGPTIKLLAPYEGETDLIEKTEIMKKYSYKKAICIGDGLTDIRMAAASQTVFARDTLAKILTQKNVPFYEWSDFDDVREKITGL